VVVERESMEREVLAEGLAQLKKWTKLLLAGVVVCVILLAAALILLWLHRNR
jgi:cell division protein FtsL